MRLIIDEKSTVSLSQESVDYQHNQDGDKRHATINTDGSPEGRVALQRLDVGLDAEVADGWPRSRYGSACCASHRIDSRTSGTLS